MFPKSEWINEAFQRDPHVSECAKDGVAIKARKVHSIARFTQALWNVSHTLLLHHYLIFSKLWNSSWIFSRRILNVQPICSVD